MTSKAEIQTWFERGVAEGQTHMIVVCDTYDWEDYPAYVSVGSDVREVMKRYDGVNMQKIMEVYKLTDDMQTQLSQARVRNV